MISSVPTNLNVIIAGNKADKIIARQVDSNAIDRFSGETNAIILPTSAKDNINIDEMFEKLAIDFLNKKTEQESIENEIRESETAHEHKIDDRKTETIKIDSDANKKEKNCCK